ncbi:Shedu anti-phage system protein SduA domain-containing protein [Streptomonospora arabica]|uniref:Shedu anti-phage system protein SduA domain-containing protein n=1 Tax=Streptomonospora arabica TaxID=412417 RepID=A0ABV9SJN6_9ACTN
MEPSTKEKANETKDRWQPDTTPERPRRMGWTTYSDSVLSEWYDLLSREPEEDQVQRFLELHPAMIPGGSGDIGPGGHHGSELSAVFRRPRLRGSGPEFEPDFMWITRSSALITPILVEIEKPSKRWFQANRRPTAHFRDAHDQLNDWRSWFAREGNKASFRDRFLFTDRYDDRPLEPQFVLVYGREAEFRRGGGHHDAGTLRHKRDGQRRGDESFMSFDALRPRYDHACSVTVTMTADGPRPFAFSPRYGTTVYSGQNALILGDPSEALRRSVMMTDERKEYLAGRWRHWKRMELLKEPRELAFRRTGVE